MPDFKGLDPIIVNQELPESAPTFNRAPNVVKVPFGGGANPYPEDIMTYNSRMSNFEGDDTIITGAELKANKRYDSYNPLVQNQEDYAAYGQGWGSKMVNGVGKGLLLTGTTFLQSTVGMVNGIAEWISTGKASSFYNNDMNKALDEFNKKYEDEWANYYTDVEKDNHWYSPSKLFSANFLWDGIIKNLGFSAGAALSGGLFAAGLKGLSALPGLAKLFSVGKAAEALAATEEAVAIASGAGKAAATAGKVKSLSDKFLGAYSTLNTGQRVLVAGLATTGEAGFEAYQNLNQFRDAKIEEYKATHGGQSPMGKDLEEINMSSDDVGNYSFLFNTALLSVTNYIQFPKILGSSYTVEKGMINSITRQTGEIIEESGKYIAKPGMKGVLGVLNRIRPYTFSASEGFEEGAQYAITKGTQDYYDKKYRGEDADFLSSLAEGIHETVSTDEGMENVVIGGLSGALMQARGKIRMANRESRNTRDAVKDLNKSRLSDFTNDTYDSVNRGVALQEERETQLKAGNITDSKDLEADYIINYLSPRVKYGRMDLVRSEIDTYRQLASTEEGWTQLQQEGKALESDTREAYLQRLTALEATAENVKSLYQSLHLRYGSQLDEKGKPLYSSDVMDKMVYAASKVADYDNRIPSVSNKLVASGVLVDDVIKDILEGKNDKFDEAIAHIESLKSVEEDILKQSLGDIAIMSLRRNKFLQEYTDIKNNPVKHKEQTKPTIIVPEDEEKKTVKIKTKNIDDEFEIGTEYYLGKVVEHDAKGNEVYRYPKLTILGENSDGTIQIQDSNGKIRSISKDVLADYKLGKVSDVAKNPTASFYFDNMNKVAYWNTGKNKSGKLKGRLVYDSKKNQLSFVYKQGKIVREVPVDIKSFKAKQGYTEGIFSFGGTLTPADEKNIQNATAKTPEEAKIYEVGKQEGRVALMADLFTELKKRQEDTNKLIEQKKNDVRIITEDITKLEKSIENAGEDQRAKKGSRFKSSARKALAAAMRLSRAKVEIEQEIEVLETENAEVESILSYVEDAVQNAKELPVDTKELLYDLGYQVELLKETIENTTKQIGALSRISDQIEKTLNSAIDFLNDLIGQFKQLYPKTPNAIIPNEWIEFLKLNPNFLKLKPNFKEDLNELEKIVTQVEDVDITPNEEKLSELKKEIADLQVTLKDAEAELRAKELIVERFDKAIEDYKKSGIEEKKIQDNKDLLKKALGVKAESIQTREFDNEYEPEARKADNIIANATTTTGDKPHAVRSNKFGVNLNKFSNRDKIRGVFINLKNQAQLIDGLVEHLIANADATEEVLDPEQFLVMVMVEEDENGKLTLVGEDGVPLADDADKLNSAVYQVMPLVDLEWSNQYGNKSMFRKTTPDETVKQIKKEYAAKRERLLSITDLSSVHTIEASFGFPQYVTYKDEKGDEKKIYTTQTSVEDAGLLTADEIEAGQNSAGEVIFIPTTNKIVSQGSVSFDTLLGVVFLRLPNGLVKLKNRQHTEQEAENIYQALYHLSKNILNGEIDSDASTAIFNYLRSIVYWGIPTDQQGNRKAAGYNSVFWEVDPKTKKFMLSISGLGMNYVFTPSSLEQNREAILTLLKGMYANINSSMVKNMAEPYNEVLEVREDGTLKTRTWDSYTAYLLSKKTPDGKVRSSEEIPLSTLLRPLKDKEDINREGVYFYTTDTVDNITASEVKKNAAPVVPPVLKTANEQIKFDYKRIIKKKIRDSIQEDIDNNTKKYSSNNKENVYVSPLGPMKGKTIHFTFTDKLNDDNWGTEITVLPTKDLADIINFILDNEAKRNAAEQNDSESYTVTETDKGVVKEPETKEETGGYTVTEEDKKESTPVSDEVNNLIKEDEEESYTITEDDKPSRVALEEDLNEFTEEQWTPVETWLKSNFPNLPVFRVKNVMNNGGRRVWGMLKDASIYVYKNAETGTTYHEVFEAVWKMFSDPKEHAAVIAEFKARKGSFTDRPSGRTVKYSDATPQEVKEQLAEEFIDYVQKHKIPAKPEKGRPYILKLFADLVTAIKTFFTGNNAEVNTQKLFEKINTGYYKNNSPYTAQLSFAKEGIIDVDDAFVDESAELRVDALSDKDRSEIIQNMTYLTLAELVDSDKSLFTIPNLNRDELYTRLRKTVLKDAKREIVLDRLREKNGEITKEELNRRIARRASFMQNIVDEWKEIVNRHEEYLRGYSIEFDENDELQVRDDDKIKNSDYVDATKIDSFKKANSAIKLLIATLAEVKSDGNMNRSSVGGAKLIPISKTFITLMNRLHTSRSIEEMMERLRELAADDGNYRSLYTRLTKTPWTDRAVFSNIRTTHGAQLLGTFWQTFKKQNPVVKNVFIYENGEITVGDANLSSAATQLRAQYVDNMVASAREGKGYLVYSEKDKAFIGEGSKVKDVRLDSINSYVKFLEKLGIVFTEKQLVNKLSNLQLNEFKAAVSGIRDSIVNSEKIFTLSGTVLKLNGRLLELGIAQAIIDNPEFESTFFNATGDKTQSFIGSNPADDLYNFLSSIDKFDEANVGNTQYRYLLHDVFAQGSNLVKRMFTAEGTRKSGSKDLMRVAYVSGTINKKNGKEKSSAKLTYKERLIQEINLNLKGWFLNLVPADATTEWMLYMGIPVSEKNVASGMGTTNEIFKEYFKSEIELVRDNRTINTHRKFEEAKQMRFFKSILGDKLHTDVLNSTEEDIEELYKTFENRINAVLEGYINRQTDSFKKVLDVYGILKTNDSDIITLQDIALPENMTENELNRQLKSLTINFMIANIEMHKLLYADPYQYYQELKRIKNFNSPRQTLINNSPQMNTVFNRVWNREYKPGDIGYTNFLQDYFRSVTHKDVFGIIDLLGYKEFEETDGSGIIGMRAYRQFRIRSGNWNDNEETQYRYDMAWEKRDKGITLSPKEIDILEADNPSVKSAYTPIKPIVSGNRLNDRGTPNNANDVVLDKFALYPLSYRVMKELNTDANILKLYNKMQRENIDYMVFEKSRVVGARTPHDTYNVEDGTFNDTPYSKNNIINIPFGIISVQSEVPSKDIAMTTRGSQITKLVTMDFMEAGVPIDFMPTKGFNDRYEAWYKLSEEGRSTYNEGKNLYKEIKYNQELLEATMEVGYQRLLRVLGISEANGEYIIEDRTPAVETLREEILKREVNDNISDSLTAFLKGSAVLESTPAYHQIRNILYSIADKEIISPKISGGMKVQIPSTLFESVRAEQVTINGKTGYTSDILDFYKDEDGKRVCQIMIGRWFKSSLSDEQLLDLWYEPNTDGTRSDKLTEEGKKVLSGIAFRIPTQKQNSIDSFVIKQFLPKEFGDSVVIPAALVQKAGSDFDIDKLSMYLKNVMVGKDGYPKLVELLTEKNSTIEERYYHWTLENADRDAKKYIKFLSKVEIKQLKEQFKERFKEINDNYIQLVSETEGAHYERLVEFYKDLYRNVITSQDSYIEELFSQGSKWFSHLSEDIKERFFMYKKYMRDNDINGPEEIRNYLRLAQSFVTSYELSNSDRQSLDNMSDLYEEELRVLGATQEQIDKAKKDKLEDFRKNKNLDIDNIKDMISEMSNQTADEKFETMSQYRMDYANELAGASGLMSFDEFSQQPVMVQNTRKALENEYIQSSQNLVSHELNFDKLIKPNSADQMKDLSKEIAKKTKGSTFNYDDVGNMLDRTFMSSLRHAFVSGKYAIGIAAVNQTNHSLNQRQPIYIDKDRLDKLDEEDRFWLGDAEVRFKNVNRIEINGKMVPTLSMIKNRAGQYISDIVSQFIDGYVDIAKGPWIMEIGATPNVASTWLFLVKLGIPVNSVAYFMNQPIIRDYLAMVENAGYSWLFIDNFVEDIKENDTYRTTLKPQLGMMIPSETSLQKSVGQKNFTEQEKVEQKFMLGEFLKYAKMANHMFLVTQGSNFDTASFNDPYLVFKKMKQLEKAQNTIISSVDDILSNSFVGRLGYTINKMRDALATILKSDQRNVRRVIEKVLTPYVDMNNYDFIKLSQKAVADLFDWAIQTGDKGFNTFIKSTLLENGGVAAEVIDFVKKVKANPKDPLFGNEVINLIEYKPSATANVTGSHNLKIRGKENKVYDQNNIIYGFRELRDVLKEKNSTLYDRIITLAILQSGLSSSILSFTSLIPYEDFEKIYNKTLSGIENLPNLDQFYESGAFERNNWGNDDIIPHMRARLIQINSNYTKSGKRPQYNPAMAFLPKNVKKAVEDKKIPNIVTISTHNREGNSDYVVFSWELQEELLTDAEKVAARKSGDYYLSKTVQAKKAQMRKSGDYSFIQRGLFKKVYYNNSAEAFKTKDKKENDYFVYKAINAWGESFKAKEFYLTDHQSVIDNGFIKVTDVDNDKIIGLFKNEVKDKQSMEEKVGSFSKNELLEDYSQKTGETLGMERVNSVADIPQNKVSGIASYGDTVTATDAVKKVLGANPHSIDMIIAGLRTRTTRSGDEMTKYKIKVGSIIRHYESGTNKFIYARVTAIHPKGSIGWKGTWDKEGWRAEDINVLDKFTKEGAAAIEFEIKEQKTDDWENEDNMCPKPF